MLGNHDRRCIYNLSSARTHRFHGGEIFLLHDGLLLCGSQERYTEGPLRLLLYLHQSSGGGEREGAVGDCMKTWRGLCLAPSQSPVYHTECHGLKYLIRGSSLSLSTNTYTLRELYTYALQFPVSELVKLWSSMLGWGDFHYSLPRSRLVQTSLQPYRRQNIC